MASYNLSFKQSVEKDLRSLPKSVVPRIINKIEDLKDNPTPRQCVKLTDAEYIYRLRVGDYRIVYEVHKKGQEIVVLYVRHRSQAYR